MMRLPNLDDVRELLGKNGYGDVVCRTLVRQPMFVVRMANSYTPNTG